jgi:hypothetical protein
MVFGNFAEMAPFLRQLGIFYMPQIYDIGTDGFTSPPKEGMLRIFSPEKSDGFGRI